MERVEAIEFMHRLALAAELLDEDAAQTAALRQTGRWLASLSSEHWDAWRQGRLAAPPELPGAVLSELLETIEHGISTSLESRLLRIPPGIFEMLELPGLGLHRARRLWRESGIVTLQQVRRAAQRNRLASLPGFGPRVQASLLAEILRRHRSQGRWLSATAAALAPARERELRCLAGLRTLALAGDARRALETIAQLVWVAAVDDRERALGRLVAAGGEADLDGGLPDSVRFHRLDEPVQEIVVVDEAHFASRLFLETGAPSHVAGILERLAGAWSEDWLPASEEEIYARAGCVFIPPELREGRGEIAAAREGRLPPLLAFADLQGVFHCHTTWSDGRTTVAELAQGARDRGWHYIGIADHSQAAFYARGLDAARLAQQAAEIASIQTQFPDVRIFHGIECDILPDGALDLDDHTLARLDYVIASVHSLPHMGRADMTRRITRALRHPSTAILGHPSGRLLLEREPWEVDWDAILDSAAETHVCLEFNTGPQRLDLDWRLLRAATGRGIRIAVDPDAHRLAMLDSVAPAVATARKGWLTAAQVINTESAARVKEIFDGKRAR
jgi:DNA polymerase (family 10)